MTSLTTPYFYGELLVLLLLAFLAGSALATVVLRLLVRRTPADVATYVAGRGGGS